MKLFAQVTNDGTAMSETVLCQVHFATHKPHFETDHDYEGADKDGPRVELVDKTWHDVSGNEAVSCNVCGVESWVPDLIGKVIKDMELGTAEGAHGPEMVLTLRFTDGSSHGFNLPLND